MPAEATLEEATMILLLTTLSGLATGWLPAVLAGRGERPGPALQPLPVRIRNRPGRRRDAP
ncbi:hypothetical protein DFQ59_10160 [Thioalbus denitrificans]|uniref:Uncharacterized protein n=1 Tax=Thioalbus denitrificans TaxID=547122 RepID=A0A369CFB6_9GAMM|nr:hypothetical protein DFQ59_10160 [Thioalbus denitrificans]